MTVRAVVFDFGNVISHFDTGRFLRRLAEHSPLSVGELSERVYGSGLHTGFEAGRISSPAFCREAISRCRAEIGLPEFVDAFTDIFTPVPGTAELIRRVATRLPVWLLSNTNPVHFRRHISKSPPFPLFSGVTLSYRVRALKPSPRIYGDAALRLGVPAKGCVYVDDVPEYAEGALRAGMRGFVFTGADSFAEELRRLGVHA